MCSFCPGVRVCSAALWRQHPQCSYCFCRQIGVGPVWGADTSWVGPGPASQSTLSQWAWVLQGDSHSGMMMMMMTYKNNNGGQLFISTRRAVSDLMKMEVLKETGSVIFFIKWGWYNQQRGHCSCCTINNATLLTNVLILNFIITDVFRNCGHCWDLPCNDQIPSVNHLGSCIMLWVNILSSWFISKLWQH